MIFTPTALPGAFLIEPERMEDERGYFARTWCAEEFARHGLNPRLVQCNVSYNRHGGTWRGMHYQAAPYQEAKLVRCARGALFDVIVDLRPDSPTYKRHLGVHLSAASGHMLYVPEGFAHGFLTLEDDTEVFYQMSAVYSAAHARGFRWNDEAFGIRLPAAVRVISARDENYPDFAPAREMQ